MVSKNASISASSTQLTLLLIAVASASSASWADFFGRNPYENPMNSASKIGSSTIRTACWTILSFQRRDAERSCFPITLRDEHASHRLRMIAATMDSAFQIAQALVETLAVLVPGDLVHPGRRISTQTLIRLRQ